MSESEKNEKNDEAVVVSGNVGIPDDNALLRIDSPGGRKLVRTLMSGLGAVVGPALRARMEARQIRQRGKAKADAIRELAKAEKEAVEMLGPERAREIVTAAEAANAIRERANARVSFQEEKRQNNIEAVAWQAAHKTPENVSEEPVNPDWIARFFESVKDVSDETMQSMWSSILAGEVAAPGKTSLRTLDVLKNLTQQDAQEFERILQLSLAGQFVYYPSRTPPHEIRNRILPYDRKIHMEECGLIHHETTLKNHWATIKSVSPTIGEFLFTVYPLPPQSILDVPMPVFSISSVGKEIARFIPAKFPDPPYILALAKFLAENKAGLRLETRLPRMMVNHGTFSTLSTARADISPEMSEDEVRVMLENCPHGQITEK